MDSALPVLILFLTVVFVVTQIVMLFLISRSISSHKKDHLVDSELTSDLKSRAEKVMERAIENANKILEEAGKKGVEILAREEMTGKTLAGEYSRHLTAVQEALKSQFEISITQAEAAYNDFIVQTGHAVNAQIDNNEKLLKEQASKMIEESKNRLDEISRDTQKMIRDEVNNQLTSVKSEIDEYKLRRMKVIDERIILILEDVIKVTLEKQFSLQEQSELVYRSLEEAKKENAFK